MLYMSKTADAIQVNKTYLSSSKPKKQKIKCIWYKWYLPMSSRFLPLLIQLVNASIHNTYNIFLYTLYMNN